MYVFIRIYSTVSRSTLLAGPGCECHTTIQISLGPPDDLEVIGFFLWSDEIVSNEEINQDQSAIRLELSIMQCVKDLGKLEKLHISVGQVNIK